MTGMESATDGRWPIHSRVSFHAIPGIAASMFFFKSAYGARDGGARGAGWRRTAARLRQLIALGEDYVLVVARRAR